MSPFSSSPARPSLLTGSCWSLQNPRRTHLSCAGHASLKGLSGASTFTGWLLCCRARPSTRATELVGAGSIGISPGCQKALQWAGPPSSKSILSYERWACADLLKVSFSLSPSLPTVPTVFLVLRDESLEPGDGAAYTLRGQERQKPSSAEDRGS